MIGLFVVQISAIWVHPSAGAIGSAGRDANTLLNSLQACEHRMREAHAYSHPARTYACLSQHSCLLPSAALA